MDLGMQLLDKFLVNFINVNIDSNGKTLRIVFVLFLSKRQSTTRKLV